MKIEKLEKEIEILKLKLTGSDVTSASSRALPNYIKYIGVPGSLAEYDFALNTMWFMHELKVKF